MFLKSKFFQIISIFTLILGLAVFAFADTIRLKDGSVIKGKIISFDNNQFIIIIGDGTRQRQLKFYSDEIESIKFDSEGITSNVEMTSDNVRKEPGYSRTENENNTVITVGSAPGNVPPVNNNPPVDNTDYTDPLPTNTTTVADAKPIQVKVKVLADNTANGWTNAGWVVRKGQRIRIVSNGRISLGNGRYSSPSGISTLPDSQKLVKDQPTGGLIAVIGDDNNDFMFIGSDYEFTAQRDGALFLGINEGILDDNSGSYDVTIEIDLNDTK
ncbi:MAG: LecA/PA-IL family lectin [Aridibacter sp.]